MTLAPGRHDKFEIWQGTVFDVTLTFRIDGVPVDLTGYEARMKIRAKADGGEVASLTSNPAAGITLGGAAGTIRLYISALVTATYTWWVGLYDLELQPPSGAADTFKLLYGEIPLKREQTR
jgi:hypothetical protein